MLLLPSIIHLHPRRLRISSNFDWIALPITRRLVRRHIWSTVDKGPSDRHGFALKVGSRYLLTQMFDRVSTVDDICYIVPFSARKPVQYRWRVVCSFKHCNSLYLNGVRCIWIRDRNLWLCYRRWWRAYHVAILPPLAYLIFQTSGLVLANRLSSDPSISVLVLEAGVYLRNLMVLNSTTWIWTRWISFRGPKRYCANAVHSTALQPKGNFSAC